MDIVRLEYLKEWTGQCPWTMSTKSMEIVHRVHGFCLWTLVHDGSPWTQWTIAMDSVDNCHGLSGQFPWTQWTIPMDLVDNIHGLSHCGESKTQRKWFLDENRDGLVDENRVNNKENKN